MSRPFEILAIGEDAERVRNTPEFTSDQRKLLLQIAHAAIASALAGEPLTDWPGQNSVSSSSLSSSSSSPSASVEWRGLLEPRGVFTTLYLHGALRGCVGYAVPHRPLHRAVAETARAAAFEDSRFWPVTADEERELKISLSILSPLFPIASEQVKVGRHGLVIHDGVRRGLLLPQVPVEHGWDRETFLDQACLKAGLPADAWRKSASIEGFTAEVFGDRGVSG